MLAGDRSEAAVRAFASALNAGAPGDVEAGLRVFTARPHDNLVQSYGAEFAAALEAAPAGEWRRCRAREGWRVMRLEVDRRQPQPAEFEDLRGVVLQDWTDAMMAEQRSAAVRALAKKYTVKVDGREAMSARARCLALLLLALRRERRVRARDDAWPRWSCARRGPANSCGSGPRAAAARRRGAHAVVAGRLQRPKRTCLRCGEAGLSGTLSIDGVGERYSAALVKVFWLDGQSRVYTLTERQPDRASVRLGRRPARHGRDRARLHGARRRAHPERLRSPAVRARAAVPGRVSTAGWC